MYHHVSGTRSFLYLWVNFPVHFFIFCIHTFQLQGGKGKQNWIYEAISYNILVFLWKEVKFRGFYEVKVKVASSLCLNMLLKDLFLPFRLKCCSRSLCVGHQNSLDVDKKLRYMQSRLFAGNPRLSITICLSKVGFVPHLPSIPF